MLTPYRSHGVVAYAVAGLSLVLATVLRFLVDPILGDHLSFSFYFLAVALAAWTGGVWPAIITAVLSCFIAEYFFTHPQGEIRISQWEELFDLLLFVTVSVVIGVLSEVSLRALERARKAEQAKDDFLATLAHELRSPLSVIHYANALQRISPLEQPAEHTELIDREVERLNVMIQDLLDVSRVARGKIRLQRRSIDASAVVRDAVDRARPIVSSHGHSLEMDVSDKPMPLHVDPVRLEQVLTNLLTNAAKYTPNGGLICVCVQPVDQSVVFTVRDNGIGIATEVLPQVFDLFVQADASSPAAEGGLGIGLALVKKLVELHGGSVQAHSAGLGHGSEFVVRLPQEKPATIRPELINA